MKRLICWATLALAAAAAVAQARPDANTAKIFKGCSLTAAGLLYNPQAKAAYHKALGPLVKEPWLAKLDGPSREYRPVQVAGEDYMLGSTCMNHDCYDHTIVLLWSGVQNVVYGKVVQKGQVDLDRCAAAGGGRRAGEAVEGGVPVAAEVVGLPIRSHTARWPPMPLGSNCLACSPRVGRCDRKAQRS
jgi:hypothetical protein